MSGKRILSGVSRWFINSGWARFPLSPPTCPMKVSTFFSLLASVVSIGATVGNSDSEVRRQLQPQSVSREHIGDHETNANRLARGLPPNPPAILGTRTFRECESSRWASSRSFVLQAQGQVPPRTPRSVHLLEGLAPTQTPAVRRLVWCFRRPA